MKSRKILFLVIIVVLLLSGLGYWKFSTKNDSSNQTGDKSTSVKPRNTVDYSPSTSEDNAASEERKNNPKSAATTLDNGPTSNASNVKSSITITGANADGAQSIRVSSIVEGVTSGTCNYSFSKSQGGSIEKKASASISLSGNQYYACAPISVSMPSKGSWFVSVSIGDNGSVKNTWASNPVKL